jgi:DNA-directed RNA polymerase subunit RPC12/RpoP
MYFTRIFYSGGEEHDFRRKANAEYKCTNCGYIHWIPNIRFPSSYDKTQELECPQCHTIGKQDKKLNLINKKQELVLKQTETQKEIEKICKEIEMLEENKVLS